MKKVKRVVSVEAREKMRQAQVRRWAKVNAKKRKAGVVEGLNGLSRILSRVRNAGDQGNLAVRNEEVSLADSQALVIKDLEGQRDELVGSAYSAAMSLLSALPVRQSRSIALRVLGVDPEL